MNKGVCTCEPPHQSRNGTNKGDWLSLLNARVSLLCLIDRLLCRRKLPKHLVKVDYVSLQPIYPYIRPEWPTPARVCHKVISEPPGCSLVTVPKLETASRPCPGRLTAVASTIIAWGLSPQNHDYSIVAEDDDSDSEVLRISCS